MEPWTASGWKNKHKVGPDPVCYRQVRVTPLCLLGGVVVRVTDYNALSPATTRRLAMPDALGVLYFRILKPAPGGHRIHKAYHTLARCPGNGRASGGHRESMDLRKLVTLWPDALASGGHREGIERASI